MCRIRIAWVLAASVVLSGCYSLRVRPPLDDPIYHAVDRSGGDRMSRFRREYGAQAIRDEPTFVGVSISGGGSRAATFGAAALEELDEAGLLVHLTAISSVSGGSLPAAYYALHRGDEDWDWPRFRALMSQDLITPFVAKLLNPWNLLRVNLTNLNRSDLMSSVFDERLFRGATFAELEGSNHPQLLVTATSITSPGKPFVFEPTKFEELNAHFGLFRVADAVIASGAFPAVFNDVTLVHYAYIASLSDFNEKERAAGGGNPGDAEQSWLLFARSHQRYEHLIDGGPTDNLGIYALLHAAQEQATQRLFAGKDFRGCIIYTINSSQGTIRQAAFVEPEIRRWYDFLVDTNVIQATDALLYGQLNGTLDSLGLTSRQFVTWKLFGNDEYMKKVFPEAGSMACKIFPIGFNALDNPLTGESERFRMRRMDLRRLVGSIETQYALTGPAGCTNDDLASGLYDAARYGVHAHPDLFSLMCVSDFVLFATERQSCPLAIRHDGRSPRDDLIRALDVEPHSVSPYAPEAMMDSFSQDSWQSQPLRCVH